MFLPRLLCAVSAFALLSSGAVVRGESFETVRIFTNPGNNPTGFLTKADNGDLFGATQYGGSTGYGAVFKYPVAGDLTPVATFNFINGATPVGRLTKGADGELYGVTAGGGSSGGGTIYRITAAGVLKTVAQFTSAVGTAPTGSLVLGADGSLYGLTRGGGGKNAGTVYKLTAGKLKVVASFDPAATGTNPSGGLVQDPAGVFWGVTSSGGTHGVGTVFKVTTKGVFTTVASFEQAVTGSVPGGGLVRSSNGNFYGVLGLGGATGTAQAGKGAVFQVTPAGALSAVKVFDSAAGPTAPVNPVGELIEGAAGQLFGQTAGGGANGFGAIFELTVPQDSSAPAFRVIDSFPSGQHVAGSLTIGQDGALWSAGYKDNETGNVFRVPITGGTTEVKALLGDLDGYNLQGGLAAGPDGALYGAAAEAGALGLGAVYKLATDGTFTRLNSFDYPQGARPFAPVVAGSDGNLYGALAFGNPTPALYRFTATGTISLLANFSTTPPVPQGANGLLEVGGAFYGTTPAGGGSAGTIFKYAGGTVSTVFNFAGAPVNDPRGSLVLGSDGAMYGVANAGGAGSLGGIFRVTVDGAFKLMASFDGKNGANPLATLVLGPNGYLYGTASKGGEFTYGTIFKMSPAGKISRLASFNGFTGAFPTSGLTFGPKGNLYGAAIQGGSKQFGTVYRVTPGGSVTVLANLDSVTNGAFPQASLTVGSDGNLYGSTYHTIFRIKTNNRPPTATDDTLTLPVYGASLTKNDRDPDGDPLRIVSLSTPAHGTVRLLPNGKVDYLPDSTFVQTDTFTYTVSDGLNGTATATVTVKAPAAVLPASAGTYAGLLTDAGKQVGYWSVSVLRTGSFTGALKLKGGSVTVSGKFGVTGTFQQQVTVGGVTYDLALTVDPSRNELSGSVAVAGVTYALDSARTSPAFSKAAPTPFAGRYTAILPPTTAQLGDAGSPHGCGYALVTISNTGAVAIAGKLGDGEAFSASAKLDRAGRFPLFAQLAYTTRGYLLGQLTFAPTAESDFAGPYTWVKPQQAQSGFYSAGFEVIGEVTGAAYLSPATGKVVAPFVPTADNARIDFAGTALSKTMTISTKNLVTVKDPGTENLSITLKVSTGLIQGFVTPDVANTKRPLTGVFFQKGAAPAGHGVYATTSAAQAFLLQPLP